MINARSLALVGATLAAVLLRLAPHPENFAPMMAISLFAGAYFANRRVAFAVPLAAVLLSDVILGMIRYPGSPLFGKWMLYNYSCYAIIICIGLWLRKNRSVWRITGGAIAGSLFFFFYTNFWVWQLGDRYLHSTAGLVDCYITAIPFFRLSFAGDMIYTIVFFGGFALAERYVSSLRENPNAEVAQF